MEALAREVVARLREAGFTAYFAGGCVRDLLMGRPAEDFDIATSAAPGEVRGLFSRTIEVGAHFGVMCVLVDGCQFEVATFRSDGAYLDGRHPSSVHFSSPREDAMRRDFTINGMFLDPVENKVIDFVGGQDDLQKRVIRAIGDPAKRFGEDRLRLLRAVRFATTLEFEIDPATWEAVKCHARHINAVSPERVRDELKRILLPPRRVHGFDLLDASGLLAEVLPEVAATRGCEQPPQFHPEGDVFTHTRIMLDLLPADASLPLVFGTLLHDIGKPPTLTYDEASHRIRFNGHDRVGAEMTENVMRRLRFSNDEIDPTVALVANHMVFKDVQKMRVARLRRFLSRPTFDDELELHRVDCLSSHGMLDNHEFLKLKQDEFSREPLIPPPLVTGRDLIGFGLRPGPKFSEILDDVQTRQLEGGLRSREEALDYVRGQYAGPQDGA